MSIPPGRRPRMTPEEVARMREVLAETRVAAWELIQVAREARSRVEEMLAQARERIERLEEDRPGPK